MQKKSKAETPTFAVTELKKHNWEELRTLIIVIIIIIIQQNSKLSL